MITDLWKQSVTVTENNFVHKSLSNWACNLAVGCGHGCRFCFVPDTSTIKQGPALAAFGVTDPDEQWGQYVLLRPWNEQQFIASVKRADRMPVDKLAPDGNRAVMFCSTTDPYQAIHHPDAARRKELSAHARHIMRRALECIRDHSTLNVRILTRSPLARLDFDVMASFGPRLLFGMSIPTLNNALARIYEPHAPSPAKRLETMKLAKAAGLHVYVAMAPTYAA